MSKRRTWKQAVEADAGYAHWTFGDNVRSLDTKRYETLVSNALKGIYSRYARIERARKFARKMRILASMVKQYGCDSAYVRMQAQPGSPAAQAGDGRSPFGRGVMNALCWGVSDGHNKVMIMRYEAAAKAAERFCRR